MRDLGECLVCKKLDTKYKFPCCSRSYCSITCYKGHDRNLCTSEGTKKAVCEDPLVPMPLDAAFDLEEDGNDYVPIKRLALLKSSQRLKNLLSNIHLRNYLKKINSAERPDLAMESAMSEPLFIEFANECLKIFDV